MFFSGKKVIVTGGAGFIGSALVRQLVAQGAQVTVIDNLWRGKMSNLKNEDGSWLIDPDKQFVLADLTDYGKCLEYIRDAEYVYHLADVVAGIGFVFDHELFIYRQNLLINTNTLGACLVNKIPNYIYVGTACSFPKHLQMEPGVAQLREEQTYPAEPESAYGWSKLMGEYEAELAAKNGKINVGLLRFHNVYGPGADFEPTRSQVIPALIRKAIIHPEPEFVIWGSGNQYRDFVYIDDIVSALLLVGEKGMNQGLIQIGTGLPTTVRDLARKIVAISGKDIPLNFDPNAPEGDRGRVAAGTRALDLLGWKPTLGLDEGLAASFRWVEKEMAKG